MKITIGLIIITVLFTGCSKKQFPEKTIKNKKQVGIEENDAMFRYFFAEGVKQKMLGKLQQAEEYFHTAVKLNKESSAAFYELSSIYTVTGNFSEAIKYAVKAEKMDEENIWYKLHLANLYHINQQQDNTIIIYEKINAKYPERSDLAFNLCKLYEENGEGEKALKIYENLENSIGINKRIGLAKEGIYEREGNFEKAKKELEKLLSIYPNDVNILGVLAELYNNNGYDQEAKRTYDKLFEIEPDNYVAKLSIIDYYRRKTDYKMVFKLVKEIVEEEKVSVNEKAKMMMSFVSNPQEMLNYKANIEIYIEMLEDKYPENYTVKATIADFFIRTGNLEKARNKLKFIIKKGTANFVLWEQYLFLENSLGNYSDLFTGSGEAIKIYPEKPTLFLLRGISAIEIDKTEISVKALEKGVKLVKNNNLLKVQFYTLLGDAFRNAGLNQNSDEAMENALKIDSENTIVLNNYAYYLSERGEKLKKAMRMSRKCLETEPLNAIYLDTYGWILYKMGKFEEAMKYLEKAMKKAVINDPEITEHYGDILYEMGEHDKALKNWKDAILLGGEKKKIEEKINKAEKRGRIK